MFRSWRLGKAFGIPLHLHPSFLLIPAIIIADSWDDPFNALLMVALIGFVFGCILLHELGHALAARAFGIQTVDITLYPMGGVASLERMAEKPLQEIAIAVAGPAVNLVLISLLAPLVGLALLTGALQGDLTAFHLGDGVAANAARFVFLLMICNGGLMLFNLLPAFPMDGGRVFRALLALAMPRLRATEIAAAVGVVLAGLLALVGVASLFVEIGNPMLILVAVFVIVAGRMELLAVRRQAEDDRVEREEQLAPDYSGVSWDRRHHVWVLWRNGQPIEVYEGAE